MKKLLCLLLTFVFLFSLAACRAAESETSNEPSTSAPAESTAPTESGDATEPEETEPEATTPEETEPPVPNIVDGLFVWNEAQFPTITSIKIGPNTFTNPDPTEEELSNFLCQAFYYWFSFYFTDAYGTPYFIPLDDTVTRLGNGFAYHPVDRAYIKSRQFMESTVLPSFFEGSPGLDMDYFLVTSFLGIEEDMRNDIWLSHSGCKDPRDYTKDPALINFVVTKKSSQALSIHAYIYRRDEEDSSDATINELDFSMIYTKEGLWKINKHIEPIFTNELLNTALREDFGTRLTIEKAD